MGAITSLFEKVSYDPKKLENYRLHYWFQERESVCFFFFLKRGGWVIFFQKGSDRAKKVGTFTSDLNNLHYRRTFNLIVFEKSKTLEIQKNSENSKLCVLLLIQDSRNSEKNNE